MQGGTGPRPAEDQPTGDMMRTGDSYSLLKNERFGPQWYGYKSQAERDVWIKILMNNSPWYWFCTFTFKVDISSELAVKHFLRWLSRVRMALDQNIAHRAKLRWFLATEPTTAGRVHLHALLSHDGLRRLNMFRFASRWEHVSISKGKRKWFPCGLARIYPAKTKAAVRYVTKYVAKGGFFDWGRLKLQHSEYVRLIDVRNKADIHTGNIDAWIKSG